MDTMFMNIVLDPVIALIGILIPLGVAYLILALQSRFEKAEAGQLPAQEPGVRN